MQEKIENHINKIKSKPENIRKQYLWLYIIVIMVIVFGIFVLSLKNRYVDKKIVEKTKEDIKPFHLFTNSLKNTFSNMTASVGSVKTDPVPEVPKNQKMIPLIPINN